VFHLCAQFFAYLAEVHSVGAKLTGSFLSVTLRLAAARIAAIDASVAVALYVDAK
jgi:hypothetical protein